MGTANGKPAADGPAVAQGYYCGQAADLRGWIPALKRARRSRATSWDECRPAFLSRFQRLALFFTGVPRVRKLTLGYKYFTATRFRDGLVPQPREGSAPCGKPYLRESASIRLPQSPRRDRFCGWPVSSFCAFCAFSRLFPLPSRSLLASVRVYSWFQFAVRFA